MRQLPGRSKVLRSWKSCTGLFSGLWKVKNGSLPTARLISMSRESFPSCFTSSIDFNCKQTAINKHSNYIYTIQFNYQNHWQRSHLTESKSKSKSLSKAGRRELKKSYWRFWNLISKQSCSAYTTRVNSKSILSVYRKCRSRTSNTVTTDRTRVEGENEKKE